MSELLTLIASYLVDDAGSIKVNETVDSDGTIVLELSVSEKDMGKVIGKHGRIATAIRTLVRAVANQNNQRVIVKIV